MIWKLHGAYQVGSKYLLNNMNFKIIKIWVISPTTSKAFLVSSCMEMKKNIEDPKIEVSGK